MEIAEMVERIQNGESDLMHDLWSKVEYFISWLALKFAVLYESSGLASSVKEAYDDIFNGCGYPALCAAVDKFERGKGSFLSLLTYCLRNEMRAFYGIRTARRDAIIAADSLNVPIADNNETELLETIVDPNDRLEAAEDDIIRNELHLLLESAIRQLNVRESSVIRGHYYNGKTMREIADELGTTPQYISNVERRAIRKMRNCEHRQRLFEILYPGVEYSYGLLNSTITNYRKTQERATERAALTIIRLKHELGID